MKPPIIIVGAGRSGTKLLRSVLASHPDLVNLPREINYIWRHGNTTYPTDELEPDHATPAAKAYIRSRLEQFAEKNNDLRVIEKTCANALRVDFVKAIFPEAKIIHLVRDGRAVAESARRRWLTPQEPGYIMEKARWIPWTDVPYYGLRFIGFQLSRLQYKDRRPASWGPRFEGLDEHVKHHSLIEVCGLQWQACVQAAHDSIERLGAEQGIEIRYEDLVQKPDAIAQKLFHWLDLDYHEKCKTFIDTEVHEGNLNKWQETVKPEDIALLMPHISETLERFGYESAPLSLNEV